MSHKHSRRNFLKKAVGSTALLGFPTIIPASVLGKNGAIAPSNKVNIGVLSCGNQSGSAGFYYREGIGQIVAVCDPVKERRLARAEQWRVSDHYSDFREVLAREDVDAVHISTPDHWHVPMSLAAARAGKDIYCEKPLGLTIEQNLTARQITERYGRVFQYGTQQRSAEICRRGIELVLNGHLGELVKIYAWAPPGHAGGSAKPVLPVPDGFDYDLWLGPAPEAPFSYDRCLNREYEAKGIWYIYDYAIGFISGWGAHPIDQLQWWADAVDMGIPLEYEATGTLPTEGLFNTVTHWDARCRYANGLELQFMDEETAQALAQQGGLPELPRFPGNCTLFVGTEGWAAVSRGALQNSSEALRRKARDPGPIRLAESSNHGQNFVQCVRSRAQPVAPLESAIQSDIICHMTDLAIRTGSKLTWDPQAETIHGSATARQMMSRPMRAPWTL